MQSGADSAALFIGAGRCARRAAEHGPTLDVQMPACPSCDHREAITLPVIWDERGTCYYARRKREWTWTSWPGND